MSDLISRQAVIDILKKNVSKDIEEVVIMDKHIKLIESVTTAYDAEKVVAELEERINNRDCKYCKYNKIEKQVCTKDCTDAVIEDLLDIVRRGGVE